MRRSLFSALCCLGFVVTSVLTASHAVAAHPSVFRGMWTSTDLDGSNQTLRISGSGRGAFGMFLFDDSATGACDGRPAHFVGSGRADGTLLVMRGALVCLPGGNPLRGRIAIAFNYSPGTDTLVDESGVSWQRE